MAVISSAPDEINMAFTNLGKIAPSQMTQLSNVDGSTVAMWNGNDRITGFFNAAGGGYATIVNNPDGLGDGKSMAKGRRFTKNFLAVTADASKHMITRMSNADGTGIICDSGAGRNATILIATGDGQSGALFTKNFVALYCQGTELILHGAASKITSTYHLIQETNKGGGKVFIKTNSGSQTLVSTDA